MWKNKKYNSVLITLMKRYPERIEMCTNCLHINIRTYEETDDFLAEPSQFFHQCSLCGKSFGGKPYLSYRSDLERAIKRFFDEKPTEKQNIEEFTNFITTTHGLFLPYPFGNDESILRINYYKNLQKIKLPKDFVFKHGR